MPLSDDELDGLERWFNYVRDNMPYTYNSEGIFVQGDRAFAILADLRAALPVVEAVRVFLAENPPAEYGAGYELERTLAGYDAPGVT